MKMIKTNIGDLFIWFGNKPGSEKITIGGMSKGIHYTFLFNGYKRVLNVHKTIETAKSGKKTYEQILEIPFFTMKRFFLSYSKAVYLSINRCLFLTRMTVDDLESQNFVLMPFALDEGKTDHFVYLESTKKMKFVKEIDPKLISERFLYPDQVLKSKENTFWIYSNNYGRLKMMGLIIRPNIPAKMEEFYFVSKRSFERYTQRLNMEMFHIINGLDFKGKEHVLAMIASN